MEQIDLDRMAHGLKSYGMPSLPTKPCPRPVGLRDEQKHACVMAPGFVQSLRIQANAGRYCVSYVGYGASGRGSGMVTRPAQMSPLRLAAPRPKAQYVMRRVPQRKGGVVFAAQPLGVVPPKLSTAAGSKTMVRVVR